MVAGKAFFLELFELFEPLVLLWLLECLAWCCVADLVVPACGAAAPSWANTDPELQPRVTEARARDAQLVRAKR